ncbi:MAG: ABC transporter permease [Anaerolineae bacterium]|nr:ABC transporter permease [Anaerolineae bacterium]
MRILHIFWREYWGNITRPSYLLFTFGFPLFIVALPLGGGLALALALRSALPPTDPRPVGLVDQAHVVDNASTPPHDPVEVLLFDDVDTAKQALSQETIQAYYHIPVDYWETGQVIIAYQVAPTPPIDSMIGHWIEDQIKAKAPARILARVGTGPSITHQGLAGDSPRFDDMSMIAPIVVFVVIYMSRLISTFTASYMFDSITNEAEDRTLEILITTVTPFQFVLGKFFGLLAVGLTQIGMWFGAAAAIVFGVGYVWGIDVISPVLTWPYLSLVISVLAATYLIDQILAAALGLKRISSGSGHLLFNTINMVLTIALLYAMYFVPRHPDAPVAVAASLFPLTASVFLLLRVVISEVPIWQIVLSQCLLWASVVVGMFWLRELLQANLVANARPTTWQAIFNDRWRDLKRLATRAK